jgi:hypothetical protein
MWSYCASFKVLRDILIKLKKSLLYIKTNRKFKSMKWPNLKFFQAIGVLGFGVGMDNAFAGYQSRATARELVAQVNRMSENQGNEVAEKFATKLYNILYLNNGNDQHFQYLMKNIEQIRDNYELINNYKTVLNSSNLDAAVRLHYQSVISELEQANQMIMHMITTNQEMIQKLNSSIAIDNSVILREINNLRQGRGGGTSNQFIDSINQIWNDFNVWIQSLDYFHSVAILNIMGLGLILLSLLQIIFIFYGTVLLDYLSLETRYPKLAKIIQLRRTFQQFYLFLNICIIAIVSIIMLFFNLTFFY